MPSSRLSRRDASSVSGHRDRSINTLTATAVSALAGLLAAVLSVPGAFALWIGISVAIGRGDPTWNDGEEIWGTALGVLLTSLVCFALYLGVRALTLRVRPRDRKMVILFGAVPTAVVHFWFAAIALS